ncbi:cytochrome P450 315a1, mitochondrial [Nasonia vitripennis]|uniref:Cytochrome P450 315a1, mitochondrial n=1 Tax=Nasonia vitripennis TaxID=7425 RepID=A0A7M7LMS7_NASVI|nr:cytochrome P450 315a1, mitochondrial [Nasonia vitripennis]XP_008212805.1 cytochrome P450 315a1, mitochondrial [Nasonia vitripennis]
MQRISKLYLSLANRAVASSLAEMPDCRGLPVIGTISSLVQSDRGKCLHEYIDKMHRRHGPMFRGRVGPTKAIFVSSTDAIREVFRLEGPTPQHFVPEAWLLYNKLKDRERGLLFMDGQEWLHYRRILNKMMLAPDSAKSMSKPCQEAAMDLVEKWKGYRNNERIVPDLENQLYQWSIEVLLATLVGSAWPSYRRSILNELGILSCSLSRIFEYSVHLSSVPARLAMLLRMPSWTGFVTAADYALDTVGRFVEEMEKLENAEDGLLGAMLRNGIDSEMLKRICVDLILAAGDTTAYSMQWLLYLMASNPSAQEAIRQSLLELDEAEVLRNALLKGAIKESLRLYPTAPFLTRILPQDTLLAGYPACKGELVVISLYSCGRDEANFPRADEFLPQRWLRSEKGEFQGVINPNATLPFAMGARSCIGRKLAEVQMSLTMAELLRNFKIDCVNKNKVRMKLRMISAPSEPLQLQLTPWSR